MWAQRRRWRARFEMLTPAYTCVYIRPHPSMLPAGNLTRRGFEADHNVLGEHFDDFGAIADAQLGVRARAALPLLRMRLLPV